MARPKATASKPAAPKAASFKRKPSNTPAIFVDDRQPFDVRSALTNPVWVPPNIEVGWAESPKRDDGNDLNRRFAQGWDLVHPDEVTDDLEEGIREGKIVFRGTAISHMGEAAGAGTVGLTNFGLVLLFRPKDVGEKYRNTIYARFRRKLEHSISQVGDGGKIADERSAKIDPTKEDV